MRTAFELAGGFLLFWMGYWLACVIGDVKYKKDIERIYRWIAAGNGIKEDSLNRKINQ